MNAHGFKVTEGWLPVVLFSSRSSLSLLLIAWAIAQQLGHTAARGSTRYLVAGKSCQVQHVPLPGHLDDWGGLQHARASN